jgi:hypothetical protein
VAREALGASLQTLPRLAPFGWMLLGCGLFWCTLFAAVIR